jgi:PIN domain nuclease of toxin-antitoxin system
MKVVADSHALVWYGHDSPRLSRRARDVLDEAVERDGLVVSVVSLVELWYVTQTTEGVSTEELAALRERVDGTPKIELRPVDPAVADAFTSISRDVMRDPWDRFIVATAQVLEIPLVTRDGRIQGSKLVETIW